MTSEQPNSNEIVVKVMSYNVHSGVGMDERYDLNRIADIIRAAEADIIGLQEVDAHWSSRSQYDDMAKQLAAKFGMNVFFAPIYELPPVREGDPVRQFGVALLSRYKIMNAINHKLTRLSTQERGTEPVPMPGLAGVTLDVEGTALNVYVAHLDYRKDPAIRTVQIRELLEITGIQPERTLVIGDMNARPDAPELIPLLSAFRDTWTEARDDPGLTFPANALVSKIDYILAGSRIVTVSSDTIDSEASDHRPLVANLRII